MTLFCPGTALVATQKLKGLTQISSSPYQGFLAGRGDALVSKASHCGQPELLQRGQEDLTTQAPLPLSFPQQGLTLAQKRQNDPIVQTIADPGTCKQVYLSVVA